MLKSDKDPRIGQILDFVFKLAAGELDTRLPVGNEGDEIDSVIRVLNRLSEKFQATCSEVKTAGDFLNNIITAMADVLIVLDADGTIRKVNPATVDLLGYEEHELLGQPISLIMSEKKLARFMASRHRELNTEGMIRGMEESFFTKNNQAITLRMSISNMPDPNGKTEGIVCLAQDITDLKRAREEISNQRLQLEKAHRRSLEELEKARMVQLALMSPDLPGNPNLKTTTIYMPMDRIGGDIYDVFTIDANRIGVMVGDLTGHGIPAALLSFLTITTFKNIAVKGASCGEALMATNQALNGKMPDGAFASMFYGIYNTKSRELRYANAGHPPGLLISEHYDQVLPLDTHGTVIGMFDNDRVKYEEKKVRLVSGDKVLLYTDAVIELLDSPRHQMGSDRLERFLLARRRSSIEEIVNQVFEFCQEYSGNQSFDDDLTMVGMEVL